MYDITNRDSFRNVQTWIDEFRDMNDEEVSGNIVIIG
jgi:hypothetical protein